MTRLPQASAARIWASALSPWDRTAFPCETSTRSTGRSRSGRKRSLSSARVSGVRRYRSQESGQSWRPPPGPPRMRSPGISARWLGSQKIVSPAPGTTNDSTPRGRFRFRPRYGCLIAFDKRRAASAMPADRRQHSDSPSRAALVSPLPERVGLGWQQRIKEDRDLSRFVFVKD